MGIREDVLTRQGDELRAWRQKGKLSQAAAAKLVGATQSSWASWEMGRKAPDNFYAGRIESLTKKRIRANGWAYPKRGTAAARDADADDSSTDVTADAAKAS